MIALLARSKHASEQRALSHNINTASTRTSSPPSSSASSNMKVAYVQPLTLASAVLFQDGMAQTKALKLARVYLFQKVATSPLPKLPKLRYCSSHQNYFWWFSHQDASRCSHQSSYKCCSHHQGAICCLDHFAHEYFY
jgi:hypothetical protein